MKPDEGNEQNKEKVMKAETVELKWKTCRIIIMTAAFLGIVLLAAAPAMAADNTGTGDIGGDGASLNDSNTFSLFSTTMSLNKMAFLANGTQLTSGATLPRGTEVRFVIYIDNTTTFPLTDVSVQDVLDPAFAYQAGSMLVDNTLSSGATQAVIYSTVNNSGAPVTDAISDDVASAVGTTIDVGNSVVGTNTQLDVAGDSVWAILFRTLMQ
jgi:uncharacterized repeat protein (TIGR01451 family)